MKTSQLILAVILFALVLLVKNLTGEAANNSNAKVIVPAAIVNGDTIPVVTLPVVVIKGK